MKLLALLFAGMLLVACSPGDAEPSPQETAIAVENREAAAQLSIMNAEIALLLSKRSWVDDGTEESTALLREIVSAQIPRPNLGQERVDEVTQLIEILESQSWYRDGLDRDEKVGLAGVFRTFNSLQVGPKDSITGKPFYEFLDDYHFGSLYASAIEAKRFVVVRPPGAYPVALIALGDVGWESSASEALTLAATHHEALTGLAAGRRPRPSLSSSSLHSKRAGLPMKAST